MIYFIYNKEVSAEVFYDFVKNNECVYEEGEIDNQLYLNVKAEDFTR
jgi:hypothetical protein